MHGRPDFLIVGAMKAGTTRLYEMICEHPDAASAIRKEIHYFTMHADRPLAWYLSHFATDGRLTGEASPTYFDLLTVPKLQQIREEFAGIKIIVIVRDPVARAVSQFVHHQRIDRAECLQGMSSDEFFGRALPDASGPITKQAHDVDFYLKLCLRFSQYSQDYLKYLAVFGADHVVLLDNAELRADPYATMNGIFRFLGLSQFSGESFEEIRYTNRSSPSDLSPSNRERLEARLLPDYERLGLIRSGTGDSHSVMESSDGTLYLTGGSNRVLELFTDRPLPQTQIEAWADLIERRANRARDEGYTYFHLGVPDKLTVYREDFPSELGEGPLRALVRTLVRRGCDALIDPLNVLRRGRKLGRVFWRTDSHWSSLGCYIAYQLLCYRLGTTAVPNLSAPGPDKVLLWDLGRKLSPMRPEVSFMPAHVRQASRVEANALVRFKERNGRENDGGLHVGSSVTYRNPQAPDPRRVLLFGDSFAEYRPILLTGMLAETFSEVRFVWSLNIDYGVVAEFRPDVLLTEAAERFMTGVPDDKLDLDALVSHKLPGRALDGKV